MIKQLLLIAGIALATQSAHAAVNVLACEPEWAALSEEVGGDRVHVSSATTAMQDPHHIQARPSLIARARNADLVVCTGAELEIGWLPLLQRESGNAAIQPGQPGYFAAANYVRMLEKPTRLDRAQGDIHPEGNPHLVSDPRNLLKVADALSGRLGELDPANAARYAARNADFQQRMRAAIARWQQEGAVLRGVPVVVHHKNWVYLADWLGLKVVADLEPKPGLDPSAAHLAELLQQLRSQPAKLILHAAYQQARPSEWLSQRTGIPAVELPYTVGGSPRAKDLFGLYDDTLAKLTGALQ
jgi:zinc/manganese transport system substrate-binding protein